MSFQNRFGNDSKFFSGNLEESSWTIYRTTRRWRKAEQIFLRGFDIDLELILLFQWMPVNMVSHAHGQGYADLHFVIPETVER
jgi:hypothetical protein